MDPLLTIEVVEIQIMMIEYVCVGTLQISLDLSLVDNIYYCSLIWLVDGLEGEERREEKSGTT